MLAQAENVTRQAKTCYHSGWRSAVVQRNYQETYGAEQERNVIPWSEQGKDVAQVSEKKIDSFMSKLFKKRKKPYNLRSQKKLYGASTPKSKVDACVECDLPFDESEIAPELRREQIPGKENSSGISEARPEDADEPNRTNLDPVDISVEPSPRASTSPSEPTTDFPKAHCSREEVRVNLEEQDTTDPDEFCTKKHSEKGRQKETITEENNLTAGGQQVPVINSPADIYKHFPRRVNYEESLEEDPIESRLDSSDNSDSEDYLSHSGLRKSSVPTIKKDELLSEINSPKPDSDNLNKSSMEAEYLRTMNELTQKLLTKDVNINKFHGYENEDVNRWFEKLELILESKGIRLTNAAARTQLINNLAGPAETFLFELPVEERREFDTLKQALVRRYSTKDRTWVKRQRLVARRQGLNELLSDYINDMHELFSGLNMAEVDKVTYFTEGLTPTLRVKVLERMPETLLEAEEVARTIDAIAKRPTENKDHDQLERLIEALNRNQQVPAALAGTSSSTRTTQPSLQEQVNALTKKLDSIGTPPPKTEKVAAYSEPGKEERIMKLIQELTNEMRSQHRRVDARINGLVQQGRDLRAHPQRSRDGRPLCFYCGETGHIQISCPQRRSRERGPVPRYTLPPPGNIERNHNQPSFQPRHRALGPSHQDRLASLNEDYYDSPNDYVAPMEYYDITGVDYEDYPGEWDDYYEYEPEEVYYGLMDEWNQAYPKKGSYQSHTDNLCPTVIHTKEIGTMAQLASNSETFKQTCGDQTTDGEEFTDNYNELAKDTPQGTRADKHDPSPCATLEIDTIEDQCTDADEIEEVLGTNQPVQSAVEDPFPPKGETADHYQEPVNSDTVHTEDTRDMPLPQLTVTPNASEDADFAQDDPEVISEAVPSQLNDGAAYTSPVSETSGETASKPKLGSQTITLEEPAYPIVSTTEKTISGTKEKENVPTHTCKPAVQDPGVKQRPARTKNVASASTKGPQPDLTVEVQINGKSTRCLVDTGAAVSVLDADHMLELYDGQPPPLKPSESKSLKTVSGENLPVRGILCTSINIAGGNYPCEFKVLEGVTYKGVLGRDFLRATRANISFDHYTLQLKDEIPVTFSEELLALVAPVTYVIPPQSETVIPAKIKGAILPGTIGLIESSQRLAGRYKLQGAAALVKVAEEESVPFRLINPTNKPVTLYKGASLGTFSEADGTPNVYPVEDGSPTTPSRQEQGPVPVDLQSSALSPDQQKRLKSLLNEYRDIFAVRPEELGRTNLVQHHIDTGDHPPLRSRPYRVPHAQKETIENHINDMLSRDVIKPSVSPWASPVVLVPKPDGSSRFCCDFRNLNKITKKDSYPLPLISESLEALGGAKFFSSIDLLSGYWQVQMDPASREKTAFVTHAGLYEFTTMPFGLCNAPGTFQRLMECVLRGLTWQIALIYLDDVLVYSRTFEEHLQHLRLVFDRFREAGLKLKPSKCHFGRTKVNYLGHVITPEGILPDPAKVKVVQEYPVPKTVKDVRAFMGLTNYYRKFIKGCAQIASPLHELTKKGAKFVWTDACQHAFDALKKALTEAPILAYPDFHLPFILATDASNDAIGMVLGQKQNGREVVISYAGRKLNPAERNYSVTEREALAVVDGVRHFQTYLYGRQFIVFTDHNAVRWLMNIKEPTGRLARWALLLQQHDFAIEHRSGKSNGNADALSRRTYDPVVAAYDKPGAQVERVWELQRKDPGLADIITYLETENLPNNSAAAKAIIHSIDDYYLDPNGLLCHLWVPKGRRIQTPKSQLVVPTPLRHEILVGGHDDPLAGHLGVNKTYDKLRGKYYWPKMFADVQYWCLSCTHCQMKKSPKQRQTAPILPIPVEGPFDRVAVDCLGPFPVTTSNNRYIVVFSDYLTRYPEAFAVPSIDAETIADLLVNHIMPRHGAPRTLLSDRGSNFLSSLVREVCFLMGTKKEFTSSYHPQCDGLVERFNGTLAQSLSHYVSSDQKDWDRYLNPVLFGYRVSPSEVTGESPFYMLYGREPRLPMDVSFLPPRDISASIAEHRARVVENIEIAHRIAKENIQRAQQRMKDYHDLHAVPVKYQVGEQVWVYTPRNRKGLSKKLAHNYHGPYRIVKFLSPVHCILHASDNRRISTIVHVSRFKPYVSPDTRPIRQPPELIDEPYLAEEDFPADSFLDEQHKGRPEPQALDCANPLRVTSDVPESATLAPKPSGSVKNTSPPKASGNKITRSELSGRQSLPLETTEPQNTHPEHPAADTSESDNGDIYQVEKLLKQRMKNGEHQFLIKWLGFPNGQNSWEPASNILNKCLIKNFYDQHPRATRYGDPDYLPRVAALLSDDSTSHGSALAVLAYGNSAGKFTPFPSPDLQAFTATNAGMIQTGLNDAILDNSAPTSTRPLLTSNGNC